jgi:hypothetical protein
MAKGDIMNRLNSRSFGIALAGLASLAAGVASGVLALSAHGRLTEALLAGGSTSGTAMALAVSALTFLFDDSDAGRNDHRD